MEWWLTTCLVLIIATFFWLRKTQNKLQALSIDELVDEPSVCVYFSSHESQALARHVSEAAITSGVSCGMRDLNHFSEVAFRRLKTVIFVIDRKIQKFEDWLSTSADRKDRLPVLKYSAFGLKDSPEASSAVKTIESGLSKLHAEKLIECKVDEDFNEWLEDVWTAFKGEGVRLKANDKYLDVMMNCHESLPVQGDYANIAQQYLNTSEIRVTLTRELKKDPESSALHVELEANGLDYKTVDNLGIFPENTDELVSEIATLQDYDLDAVFKFVPKLGRELPFPTPCTVRTALSNFCDLTGLYSKQTIKNLAEFATSDEEKEQLLHLTSLKGKADYARTIQAPMMSLSMLFKAFPSIKCPVHYLVQILPRIQPRYFTLASSAKKHPESMHIAVAVTRHYTAEGARFTGLCSGFLERMHLTKLYRPVRVFLKPSTFKIPQSPSPLWMICNGCGIAPFRAVLQELEWQAKQNEDGVNEWQDVNLVFGCKTKAGHMLYKSELEGWLGPETPDELAYQSEAGSGLIRRLFMAFSKERNKLRVQELLPLRQEELWEALEQGGTLQICGSSEMGKGVQRLLETLATDKGKTPDSLKELQTSGQLQIELWG